MNESPAFLGFPAQGIRFLENLADNNEREWFQAHKQDYLEHVLAPARDFVFALGERLKSISPRISYDTRADGSGSIMRIYRDLRFSKDKSPYNTNIRIIFWEGDRKKMENPGFYVRIDPRGVELFAGVYAFTTPFLAAYRDAVSDDKLGSELQAVLTSVRGAGKYEIGGKRYERVPRGYDADHPRADLLRYNGLYAQAPAIAPELITSPQLVEVCFEHSRNMVPLQQWLVKVGHLSGV
jgi:uncharacterized protein (TIGR02453 family)